MERKTQTGYLLLADISGYTSFVAQTEIEHADMALSFLLETIIEKLSSLLTISKLEGDAVFAYIEESKLEEARSLLELIDQTYLAFRDKALALFEQATCPCRGVPGLPQPRPEVHGASRRFHHPAGGRASGTCWGRTSTCSTGWRRTAFLNPRAGRVMPCSQTRDWNACGRTRPRSSSRPNRMSIWGMSRPTSGTCTSATRR